MGNEKSVKPTIFLVIALLTANTSCGSKVASSSDSSTIPQSNTVPATGTTTDPTTPPPSVSTLNPLALKMYTKYDNQVGNPYVSPVLFADGTDQCAATPGNTNVTCTVAIPEGRLYYSGLTFAFSWDVSVCTIMSFQPYYYTRSIGGLTPPGATAPVDCSGASGPAPPSCWGGAAPQLVTDFPKFNSLVYLPNETDLTVNESATLTVTSAFSDGAGSNRKTADDYSAAKWGTAIPAAHLRSGTTGVDPYLANSYVPYSFSCRDHWYDPQTYTINLFITDVDSAVGNVPEDDFWSWKEY